MKRSWLSSSESSTEGPDLMDRISLSTAHSGRPPLLEVTSTLLKVVEKTEEHTHKLVIPEKYESLFVPYLFLGFCNDLFRSSRTFGLFVSLLQNWQLTLTGIVFRPHLLLSPPYKGISPPFTSSSFLSLSDVPNINPLEAEVVLTSHTLDGEGVSAPSHLLDSLLTATQVFLLPLHSSATEIGERSVLKRKQRQAKDKRRKIHTRRKEEKNKRQMVVNQKRRKTKTQLLNQTKWNRIRSVRLPNTLPDTSHHTPCHSNHNVQSSPDFDAEWHSYSHNEVGVGKSDERGEKERKKVVVKFMIDSLLSFIRKEMKTRTIKLVTLNPTRIVDNAQSELIVVFFPPLCSTGLDETKRAPNAFEMSVVGFDEFSIEPLFVTAGEKSMLLNSHLKTTRMKQKVKNNELLIFISCKTIAYRPHSFVPKDMSADGYWEEDGKNTANANTLLFSSLVRRIPPNHIMLLLLLDE
ncbi:hypothetical protein BLNAU_23167 [Blattamonas nauphoetae]|uniref:Uncharacterized protein n=1 Tax=Blattamonas nauphoetae TaxID=2049346 RepID=A0ABQ9WR03_9EUKA|nr:hypothetical protein BLNAU_23167 [Blattamonas nauphoetae]